MMDRLDEIRTAAAIIEAGCRDGLVGAMTVEDKLRVAFKDAHAYWMTNDEDIKFKGGLGAVMMCLGNDSPDRERITTELYQIKILAAAIGGVPVNFEQIDVPEDFVPIGLIKIWQEEKLS